jgi:hypothetical protein
MEEGREGGGRGKIKYIISNISYDAALIYLRLLFAFKFFASAGCFYYSEPSKPLQLELSSGPGSPDLPVLKLCPL